MVRALVCIVFAALWLAWSSFAGEVAIYRKNGDRVTGTIASETATEVTLQSGLFGKVTIPVGQIAKREDVPVVPVTTVPVAASITNSAPVVAAASSTANAPAALPTTNAVAAAAAASSTNKVPAVAAVPAPKPPAPPKPKYWNTELQFGLNLRAGAINQEEALIVAKSTYSKNKFREILDYTFAYGETQGTISANRMNGSAKTEYDLSKKVYAFGLAGASYDEIRLIDRQFELNPGFGYTWVKEADLVFKTEFGFGYQEQFFRGDNHVITYAGRLAGIVTWRIWDKLMADAKLEYFPNVMSIDEYRVRFESTLRYPLLKNVSLNLIVIDIYDTRNSPGVVNNDLQVRAAIGVKF